MNTTYETLNSQERAVVDNVVAGAQKKEKESNLSGEERAAVDAILEGAENKMKGVSNGND